MSPSAPASTAVQALKQGFEIEDAQDQDQAVVGITLQKVFECEQWRLDAVHEGDLDINRKVVQLTLLSQVKRSQSGSKSKSISKPIDDCVYQLKVTLKDVRPPVWRRFLAPSRIPLDRLHLVIQVVMGWRGRHLYEFKIGQRRIGEPAPPSPMTQFFGDRTQDASRIRLGQLRLQAGARFIYLYDFGDDWEHQVVVEKTSPLTSDDANRVVCLAGQRACPPEDCGGAFGHQDLLQALEEPSGSSPSRQSEWSENMHRNYDPEHFDLAEVNAQLADFNPLGKNHSARRR
jgi:Plasmid pRiA4b ORF-3-like protein